MTWIEAIEPAPRGWSHGDGANCLALFLSHLCHLHHHCCCAPLCSSLRSLGKGTDLPPFPVFGILPPICKHGVCACAAHHVPPTCIMPWPTGTAWPWGRERDDAQQPSSAQGLIPPSQGSKAGAEPQGWLELGKELVLAASQPCKARSQSPAPTNLCHVLPL